MSHVLFVEKKLRTDKLGMLYLSSIMKNSGHDVDMIQDDVDDMDEYLAKHDVDIIMYSVMTGEHQWYIQKNTKLKEKYDFVSVVGGPHFTFFPEQGENDPCIDYVVRGPAEDVILDVIEGRVNEKVVMGHIPDINALPFPDRTILYKYDEFGKARMKRFIASRDCYHRCKFCYNPLFHKLWQDEKHMFHQRILPDKMIKEIERVRKDYGLELVYFNDDDLAGSREWLIEFCEKFKSKVGLFFCGSIRASSVDYDLLKVMADAGCTFLLIGLQSANEKTLKLIGRTVTSEQVRRVCEWCDDLAIKVRVENMIGLPTEDPLGDALETLEFNMGLKLADSWTAIFQPFPKTELWQYCVDRELINSDTNCVRFYDSTVLAIDNAEKINRLHKWWYFVVKHRMPMELVDILLEIPLDEKQSSAMWNLRWKMAAREVYGL